jgi:YVTN family beta-propeller protein
VAAAVLSSAALPDSPAVAVLADGAGHRCALPTAYVVSFDSGTVTPIRTRSNTAGPPITVGSSPVVIAITPDGRTAYVANGLYGTVTPIHTRTNTAGPPIHVGQYPFAIAITPDGRTAYVANEDSGTVTPIHTRTNTAGPPVHVGRRPIIIAITPGQRIGYAHPAGAKQLVSAQGLGT